MSIGILNYSSKRVVMTCECFANNVNKSKYKNMPGLNPNYLTSIKRFFFFMIVEVQNIISIVLRPKTS